VRRAPRELEHHHALARNFLARKRLEISRRAWVRRRRARRSPNQNRIIFDSGLLWNAGIVTELTLSDGSRLIPAAMNNLGLITGPVPGHHAVFWEEGVTTEIPVDRPLAINDLGHVLAVSAGSARHLGRRVVHSA
jgi:hypothetical protein